MPCSPSRLVANRRDATKSTGPRTAAARARSRAVAVEQGLTGAGVALPTVDVAVVAGRFETIRDELAPRTVLGAVLARRVAMLSVRLDRSARQEAAALAGRVERAGADFDEARMAEVQRLIREIDEDPAGAVRRLRRMPEGVDRLVAGWTSLRDDLNLEGPRAWSSVHLQIAEQLSGRPPAALGFSRVESLHHATNGDFQYLGADDAPGLDDRARRQWALDRLAEIVDDRIAELKAHRATLDHAAIARDRDRAADRAQFDPSQDAALARKYEAAAERGLFRALQELRTVEAEAAAQGQAESELEVEVPQDDPLGSSSPGAQEAPPGPDLARPDRPRGPVSGPSDRPIPAPKAAQKPPIRPS